MKYYENLYYYGKYILYGLYVITYLGLWNSAPTYLEDVNYFLKILVGLILIIFFNPLQHKNTFTKFHRDVAFSAGFFLLASTTLTSFKNEIMDLYHRVKD